MGEIPIALATEATTRPVGGAESVRLLQRVVESLAITRPGRYTVYLGRPDPAVVAAHLDAESRLIRSAKRAVVSTPASTPLPKEGERRDPGLGWLAPLWFSAVIGEGTAMALVWRADEGEPEEGWLLTDPAAVRRFIGAVEAELARPDPQLLAV